MAGRGLLLFGGQDHKVFLGCLDCNRFDATSLCNAFGEFGSKFNQDSIWNRFGTYGSMFSQYSPWNQFSQHAPIIVDDSGNSFGYFTINALHHDRTRIGWLLEILDYYVETGDLDATRDKMCG